MSSHTLSAQHTSWLLGVRDAVPLLGGYIPVAISFGLITIQAGFSTFEALMISTLIYAGASQFLFVGMIAAGSPLWLVVVLSLLINARHVVYAPNLTPWIGSSRWWPWLMHGLTDQIFALAHTRLPQLAAEQRLGWFTGASLLAWFSWVGGTAIGAVAGETITTQWPLLGEVMAFALPALFLVLIVPRFTSREWYIALIGTIAVALLLTVYGFNNAAIPVAALCGSLFFYLSRMGVISGGKTGE